LSFNNAIDIASYDDAYTALTRINNYETYVFLEGKANLKSTGCTRDTDRCDG